MLITFFSGPREVPGGQAAGSFAVVLLEGDRLQAGGHRAPRQEAVGRAKERNPQVPAHQVSR